MNINKNQILIGMAVLAVIITGILISSKSNSTVLSFLKFNSGMSAETISKKSIDYLNKNVLQQGQTAELVSVSDLKGSGILQIKIKIGSKTYDSYVSKDGKLLFPQAFNIGAKPDQLAGQNFQQPAQNQKAVQQASQASDDTKPPTVKPADIKKVAKPKLDVFLVARCPFGIQTERYIDKAIKSIPALADYINIRFIGDVSGDTTVSGNLNKLEQE